MILHPLVFVREVSEIWVDVADVGLLSYLHLLFHALQNF
jgi:hypothetical protein